MVITLGIPILQDVWVHILHHFLPRGTTTLTSCLLPWMTKPFQKEIHS